MKLLLHGLLLISSSYAGSYSYSYSSSCFNGVCSSPSMRSSVNNCGGNCCSGTSMGRSGLCTPRSSGNQATSSFSVSSSTRPRFRPAMTSFQTISRKQIPRSTSTSWSSWSSWSSGQPMKMQPVQAKPQRITTKFTNSRQIGQAFGPNCILCKQPSANQRRPAQPANQQNEAGRGCSSGFTRVGSGCRRHVTQTMLTGPTNNDDNTGDCYRVGGNCYTNQPKVQSRGARRGAAQQQQQNPSVPVRNNPSVSVQPPPKTGQNQPIKRRSEIEVLDYIESEELVSDESKVDYIDCIDCDYSQYGNSNSYQGSQLAYQNPQSASYETYEYEIHTEPPTLPPTLPPIEPPTQQPVKQQRRNPRRRQRQRVSSWESWGSEGSSENIESWQEQKRRGQQRQAKRQRSRGQRRTNGQDYGSRDTRDTGSSRDTPGPGYQLWNMGGQGMTNTMGCFYPPC